MQIVINLLNKSIHKVDTGQVLKIRRENTSAKYLFFQVGEKKT